MADISFLPIAIHQFRRDWPAMAAKLADLREKILSGAESEVHHEIARIAERVPGWTGLPPEPKATRFSPWHGFRQTLPQQFVPTSGDAPRRQVRTPDTAD